MSPGANQKTTVDDVAEAVREWDEHVATASQVANELDVSTPTARKWLKRAHNEGEVGRQELPNGAQVWFPPRDGQARLQQYDDGEPPDLPEGGDRDAEEPSSPEPSGDGGARDSGAPPADELEAAVASVLEPALIEIRKGHAESEQEMIQEVRKAARESAREAAREMDDDTNDGPEGPYADVRSPARRGALRERDTTKQLRNLFALLTASALGVAFFVARFVPSTSFFGVTPVSATEEVTTFLAVAFLTAAIAWGVLSLLLRLRVFERTERTLPAGMDPNDDSPDDVAGSE